MSYLCDVSNCKSSELWRSVFAEVFRNERAGVSEWKTSIPATIYNWSLMTRGAMTMKDRVGRLYQLEYIFDSITVLWGPLPFRVEFSSNLLVFLIYWLDWSCTSILPCTSQCPYRAGSTLTCWAGTCPWYPGSSPPLCLRWRPARCQTSRPGSAAPRRTPCRKWNRCSPVRSDSLGSIGSYPPDALSLQKHTWKQNSFKRCYMKPHVTGDQKKWKCSIGFNFWLHITLLHSFNTIQIALSVNF